jgi:hypothetical protein
MTSPQLALLPPLYLPGQEPLPPGTTNEEADAYRQAMKYQKWMGYVPESCPFKLVLSGGMGEFCVSNLCRDKPAGRVCQSNDTINAYLCQDSASVLSSL